MARVSILSSVRECKWCGKPFKLSNLFDSFCSRRCSSEYDADYDARYRSNEAVSPSSPSYAKDNKAQKKELFRDKCFRLKLFAVLIGWPVFSLAYFALLMVLTAVVSITIDYQPTDMESVVMFLAVLVMSGTFGWLSAMKKHRKCAQAV